jgi:hypothetical protein
MKNFLKVLTFAVVLVTMALFVPGCDNPSGGDPTDGYPIESPDNTALVDKLVEHFNRTTVNIAYSLGDLGWFQMDMTTAPALGIGASSELTGLVEGIEFSGAISYIPAADGAAPYLAYKFSGKNPQTLDPVVFTRTDVDRIVEAMGKVLGSYTNTISTDFMNYNPHADYTDGYAYLGSVTGVVTEFPDAGNIGFTFEIVKDPSADEAKPLVSAITGVSVSESSEVTITGADSVAGAYDSASKTLTATIPASGITVGGAGGVAAALVSTITGKITNNKDLGYARPLSASGVVNGANAVVSVKLGPTFIQAAALAGVINDVESDAVIVSGTAVNGDFVTELADIPGATEGVTAAYNPDDHVLTFIISAPAGYEFDPAANYGAAGGALGGKIAITTDDEKYTSAASTPTAVSNGKLVITVILQEPHLAAVPIINVIKGASDGDLTGVYNQFYQIEFTGALITALANISDVTGAVTVAPVMNEVYQTTGLTFTIAPAEGYPFSTDPGAYGAAASALNGKIGTVSVPGFAGPPTLMSANGTQAALTGGNLVLTVSLVNQ